jgi:hypothetical protein
VVGDVDNMERLQKDYEQLFLQHKVRLPVYLMTCSRKFNKLRSASIMVPDQVVVCSSRILYYAVLMPHYYACSTLTFALVSKETWM